MYKNLGTYLILGLPLILKYVFLLIFLEVSFIQWRDLVEDIFFLGIIISLLSIKISKKQIINDGILFVYILCFILETGSYLAISSNFTSSYMYVLLETSKEEFREFSNSYFKFSIIIFVVAMLLVFLFLRTFNYSLKKGKNLIKNGASIVIILAVLKFSGWIEYNAYHNIVRGVYGYYELQKNFTLETNIEDKDIKVTSDNDILVVVLGESTNRNHMQLYDYHRETTPKLYSFKDSMLVYKNVISTDVLTLKSVPKMFTSLTNKGDTQLNINIVDVFKKAGFKTYWLSNQRPISYHDNAISKIASSSHYFKFFNHKIDKHTTVLDEVMLPVYKQILEEDGKKVIFIRLIGTHFDYEKRYPSTFNKFITKNPTIAEKTKDHYDNAILYNDYIVFSILDSLKKLNKKSALVYLSDHGENVYDDGEFLGRTEANMTKSMFEIPFFVWVSRHFEKPDDFEFMPNRKFMTDHLYESLGHLFGVIHSEANEDNSIFSKYFKERKRIVVNGLDYDSHF